MVLEMLILILLDRQYKRQLLWGNCCNSIYCTNFDLDSWLISQSVHLYVQN